MTRDEAYGIGYICGHAQIGTEDSKIPDVNRSGALRGEYRRGFEDGASDAIKGVRHIGAAPLHLSVPDNEVVPHKGWDRDTNKK